MPWQDGRLEARIGQRYDDDDDDDDDDGAAAAAAVAWASSSVSTGRRRRRQRRRSEGLSWNQRAPFNKSGVSHPLSLLVKSLTCGGCAQRSHQPSSAPAPCYVSVDSFSFHATCACQDMARYTAHEIYLKCALRACFCRVGFCLLAEILLCDVPNFNTPLPLRPRQIAAPPSPLAASRPGSARVG